MRILLKSLLFFLFTVSIDAQQYSFEFGKVTKNELTITDYQSDSSISAIGIYKKYDIQFPYNPSGGFKNTVLTTSIKIKILTNNGLKYSEVKIPYSPGVVMIGNIKAFSYTLIEGKIVKKSLKRSQISDIKISKNRNEISFTIPDVEIGSIIEYTYNTESANPGIIRKLNMQAEVPLLYSEIKSSIPKLISFNKEISGHHEIEHIHKEGTLPFTNRLPSGKYQSGTTISNEDIFIARDLPAIKEQGYVWNIAQHLTFVSYTVHSSDSETRPIIMYSKTWKDADEVFLKELSPHLTEFYEKFKERAESIKMSEIPDIHKITSVINLLKCDIQWDSTYYAIHNHNIAEIFKKSKGSCSELNIMAYSILLNMGYDVKLTRIRSKDVGEINRFNPVSSPNNVYINTIILENGEYLIIDAATNHIYPNTLPPILMVNSARIIDPDADIWIDLSQLGNNSFSESINLNIDESGNISGQLNCKYNNTATYQAKTFASSFDTEAEYAENLGSMYDFNIVDFKSDPIDSLSQEYNEMIIFSKEAIKEGEELRIKPFFRAFHNKEDFSYPTRSYPIQFEFPYTLNFNARFIIPDSYEVVELPKNRQIIFDEDKSSCLFQISSGNNAILLRYRFILDTMEISHHEYTLFRDYFIELCKLYEEEIVLRKR